ncbi:MAG: PAS domain-containing protein, partial [Deltaproteobacteria bacterium]|nr:PAS domain-containing protein [Deltaproteobacteria bacterium]
MPLSDALARGFSFDRLPVAALLIELDGTIAAANPAAERVFDRPGTALVGAPLRAVAPALERRWHLIVDALLPTPDDAAASPTGGRAARAADVDAARHDLVEALHLDHPREPRELELTFAVLDIGRPIIQVFAHDVTRHKLAEDAARARGEAEEQQASRLRLESLGLVAGGIAHDFNNLLVGVLAEASAAREDRGIGESTLEALRRIEAAARRMAQLTRQLLAYAGRGQVVTSQVNADEHVLDLREQLDRLAADATRREGRGRRVALAVAPSAGQSVVDADANLLRQVVLNLVANAADAGSQRVDVATRVISRDGAAWWQLEVSDDGPGIDAQTLLRIFEPFFSTKPAHHGLGLSAVHGIVRRLGGDVDVDSKPGLGARFRVQLPIIAGAP